MSSAAMQQRTAEMPRCRVCGCTRYNACRCDNGNPCYWIRKDLCSMCADPKKKADPKGSRKLIVNFHERSMELLASEDGHKAGRIVVRNDELPDLMEWCLRAMGMPADEAEDMVDRLIEDVI